MIIKVINWLEHFQDIYSKKFKYHIYLFCFLGLIFLFYRLYSSGGFPVKVGLFDKRIMIMLCIFFYFLSTLFQFCSWREMIWAYKPGKKYLPLMTIHYLSLIAKYIPGAGWNYFGRNVLLDQWLGIPSKVTVRMFSLEICAVFTVLVFYSVNILIFNLPLAMVILILTAVLVVSFTAYYFFFKIINSELIFKNFNWVSLKVFCWSLLSFISFIIAFVVLIPGSQSVKSFLYLVGVYGFSTLTGFISPFPAGIGVREAIPLVFLTGSYGEQLVLAATLGMRIIIISCDVVSFFFALLVNKYLVKNCREGQISRYEKF